MQKAALNVNVAISKITTGQPRAFRRLVADFCRSAALDCVDWVYIARRNTSGKRPTPACATSCAPMPLA